MYKKQNKIIIIGCVFVALVTIIVVINLFKKDISNYEVEETLSKTEMYQNYDANSNEYYHEVQDNYIADELVYGDNREIACILLNDERERWDYLPLTKSFLEKYKNRKVIEDENIIEYSYNDAGDEMMMGLDSSDSGRRLRCKKKDGIYASLFELKLDKFKRIEDIMIVKDIVLFDSNGYSDDYYIKFNEDNYMVLFRRILFPSFIRENEPLEGNSVMDRSNIALSNKFLKKYGYDKDVIENDEGVPLSSFELKDGNFEKGYFTCICGYHAKNLWKKYTINFVLSESGKLDDIMSNEKK